MRPYTKKVLGDLIKTLSFYLSFVAVTVASFAILIGFIWLVDNHPLYMIRGAWVLALVVFVSCWIARWRSERQEYINQKEKQGVSE